MTAVEGGITLAFGLGLAVVHIWLNTHLPRTKLGPHKPRKTTGPVDYRRQLEYETLNAEIRRRSDVMMAAAGTVFIGASFVLLGQAAFVKDLTNKLLTALAALGVYVLWLFTLNYTTMRLDAITFQKLHELEGELGISVHRYLSQKIEGSNFIWLRRSTWVVLLIMETVAAAYILWGP